jgi:hypothetical protein
MKEIYFKADPGESFFSEELVRGRRWGEGVVVWCGRETEIDRVSGCLWVCGEYAEYNARYTGKPSLPGID